MQLRLPLLQFLQLLLSAFVLLTAVGNAAGIRVSYRPRIVFVGRETLCPSPAVRFQTPPFDAFAATRRMTLEWTVFDASHTP